MARTRILRPPGVFADDVILPFSILSVFRFRLFAFTEAVSLRSMVLQNACAPTATRVFSFSFFGEGVVFFEHFCIITVISFV